jgi:calcineurin-like phosphoesterase family protein
MIDQVLSQQFVLEQIGRAATELAAPRDDRRGDDPLAKFSDVERAAALQEVRDAMEREKTGAGTLYPSFDRGAEREDESALKDFAFISQDPIISVAQSAIEHSLLVTDSQRIANRQPPLLDRPAVADDRRGGAELLPAVTDLRIRGLSENRRAADGRRLLGEFSQTDPRWLASWISEGIAKFRNPTQFPPNPATPVSLADKARLVLVGDWGSGIRRAQKVAEAMRVWIAGGINEGFDTHVVHLGDVYYSGWGGEYKKRFIADWPVLPTEANKIGSWSLNGNHDMFSGGHDFFGTLLAEPRFARQERSSRFSFTHKHWEILGLDTAFEEHDLKGDQAAWVNERLKAASPRKGMLLSHHQLFSAYEKGGPNLATKLKPVLEAGLVKAWFWGHEHRCVLYRPEMGVQYARCIGHGGVPVYQWRKQDGPVKAPAIYEFRGAFRTFKLSPERWALFGFAVLDLAPDGPATVNYVDENHQVHKTEVLV